MASTSAKLPFSAAYIRQFLPGMSLLTCFLVFGVHVRALFQQELQALDVAVGGGTSARFRSR